ncbi:hypothetical protein HDU97_000139 [Phlyctochytrium planicorne]|nr:hypothetical protein HDU97_000139 [Phlyctochytrium planicorne]
MNTAANSNGVRGGGIQKRPRKERANPQKATACDNCYRLKRKCDGSVPLCGLCQKTGVECTYIRRFVSPTLIRRPKKETIERHEQSLNQSVEERIHGLEATVKSLLGELFTLKGSITNASPLDGIPSEVLIGAPGIGAPTMFPSPPEVAGDMFSTNTTPSPDFGMLDRAFPGLFTPDINTNMSSLPSLPLSDATWSSPSSSNDATDPDILEAILNSTTLYQGNMPQNGELDATWLEAVEDAFTLGMGIDTQESNPEDDLQSLLLNEILVSEEETDKLLMIAFEGLTRLPIHFIHEGYTLKKWREKRDRPSRTLVMTLCALASSYTQSTDGSYWPSADAKAEMFKEKSEKFFMAAIASLDLEQPSIETCQALICLTWYCSQLCLSRTTQAWILSGMAQRMIALLKLDIDPDNLEQLDRSGKRWTWLEKETRRRVFYTIVSLDHLDMVIRETSSGLWKKPMQVKKPSSFMAYLTVNLTTEEPTMECKPLEDDSSLLMFKLGIIGCEVTEYNLLHGTSYVKQDGPLGVQAELRSDVLKALGHSYKAPVVDDDDRFLMLDKDIVRWLDEFPPGLHPGSLATAVQFSTPVPPLNKGLPPYYALKMHMYYFAMQLALHRPRLIRELVKLMRSGDPAAATVAWGQIGRQSLRRCMDAASGIIRVLIRRIQILPPSPLPQGPPRPVFIFVGAPEARAILEAGVHFFFMARVLFLGKSNCSNADLDIIGGQPNFAMMAMVLGEFAGVATYDAGILLAKAEEAREEALEGLAVCLAILSDISRRKSSVTFMHSMLDRMTQEAGIDVSAQVKEFEDSILDIRKIESLEDHSNVVYAQDVLVQTMNQTIEQRVQGLEGVLKYILSELSPDGNGVVGSTSVLNGSASAPASVLGNSLNLDQIAPRTTSSSVFRCDVFDFIDVLDKAFPEQYQNRARFDWSDISGDSPSPGSTLSTCPQTETTPTAPSFDMLDADNRESWLDTLEDAFSSGFTVDSIPDGVDADVVHINDFSLSDCEIEERFAIAFEGLYRVPIQLIHGDVTLWRLRELKEKPSKTLTLTLCCLSEVYAKSPDGSYWPVVDTEAMMPGSKAEMFFYAALRSLDMDQPSMQLLKLYVDPDELELSEPLKPKWTWLEKETRRRVFYAVRLVDSYDMAFRENSFGVWKQKLSVKPMAPHALWVSVDPQTGEPTVSLGPADTYPSMMVSQLGILIGRITEFNLATGISYLKADGPLSVSLRDVGIEDVTLGNGLDMPADAMFAYLDSSLSKWIESFPSNNKESLIAAAVKFSAPLVPKDGLPSYHGIKAHVMSNALRLSLHRPRLIRELGRAVKAGGPRKDEFTKAWSDAGKESLQRCIIGAAGILWFMLKRIEVPPPSPFPQGSARPVFMFAGGPEIRTVLEAGLHFLFMSRVLGASVPFSAEIAAQVAQSGVIHVILGELFKSSSATCNMSFEDKLVHAQQESLKNLAICLTILDEITQRSSAAKFQRDLLEGLALSAGIDVSLQAKEFVDTFKDIRVSHYLRLC